MQENILSIHILIKTNLRPLQEVMYIIIIYVELQNLLISSTSQSGSIIALC